MCSESLKRSSQKALKCVLLGAHEGHSGSVGTLAYMLLIIIILEGAEFFHNTE